MKLGIVLGIRMFFAAANRTCIAGYQLLAQRLHTFRRRKACFVQHPEGGIPLHLPIIELLYSFIQQRFLVCEIFFISNQLLSECIEICELTKCNFPMSFRSYQIFQLLVNSSFFVFQYWQINRCQSCLYFIIHWLCRFQFLIDGSCCGRKFFFYTFLLINMR